MTKIEHKSPYSFEALVLAKRGLRVSLGARNEFHDFSF